MLNDERAVFLLNKYGDDMYRFAYVLTCADNVAAEAVSDAFFEVTGKKTFTGVDSKDKELLLAQIYKNASKRKPAVYDEKYGKKGDTFNELMKMPVKDRAISHLMLYEDMTEQKAKEVLGVK